MSFLSGIISGSLVAGGLYYAVFSYDLQTRTTAHKRDLKLICQQLQEPEVPAPPPASVRIYRNPRTEFLIQRWNDEIAGLFRSVLRMDKQISELGRKIVGDTDK